MLVGPDNRPVKFRFGLLGARKADILVLAVSGLVAGHGNEQPLGALHDLDAPNGENTVNIDRGGGLAASSRTDGMNFYIVLGNGRCCILRQVYSSFSKFPVFLTGVVEHFLNALGQGREHRFPEQGIKTRQKQGANDNRQQDFE